MSNHRDKLDSWLDADVQPLPPPPGTFERLSRRARRRKGARAIASAAGAAVLVSGLAFAPWMAGSLLGHQPSPAAPGQPSAITGQLPRRPAPSLPSHRRGAVASRSATALPTPLPHSSLSPAGSGQPVPAGFRPTSVTFIGINTGAVIGQDSIPGRCAPPAAAACTSLAGTSDYGQTWYGVSAPVTGPPAGSAGVSGLRFLNASDGWAFGPELWVTHNGGARWAMEPTHGLRVTSLETAGNRAFALFASCAGKGASFAAQCTSFRLYSSGAGSDSWHLVPGAARYLRATGTRAGQAATASLVLAAGPVTNPAAGTGYLLAPSGAVLSGPLAGGPWTVACQAPCQSAVTPVSGQLAGPMLTAGSDQLFVACTSTAAAGARRYVKKIYSSADGGQSWQPAGTVLGPGIATSLAAAQGGLVVLATTTCIDVSADGGANWRQAYGSPPGAGAGRTGFSYVGMTDQRHGVAVPADAGLHEVLITVDGGSTWQRSAVRSG